MTDSSSESPKPNKNTVDRILADIAGVHATIDKVDGVISPEYTTAFAEQQLAILEHADPSFDGFSRAVGPSKRQDFIWAHLAGACQEATLAWNNNRLASPAGAKRCLRVALEYFCAGVLEGIPDSTLSECWRDRPRKVPVWKMVFPKGWDSGGAFTQPLVPGHQFPHALKAVLPNFPEWGDREVDQFEKYLKEHLHPFAHGTAGALGLMFKSTTMDNPSMGIRFEASHIESYRHIAEEIVSFCAMCHNILNCATRFLVSES